MAHACLKISCILLLLLLPAGCLRRELLEEDPGIHYNRGDKVFVGDTLPDFEVTDLEGAVHSGDGYRNDGKATVLALFDARCADCAPAMLALSNISESLSGEAVEFVGISCGNNLRDVKSFTDGLRIAFPVCPVEDRSVYEVFCRWYVPRVYIVDRDGVIRIIHIEKVPDEAEFEKEIVQHVK